MNLDDFKCKFCANSCVLREGPHPRPLSQRPDSYREERVNDFSYSPVWDGERGSSVF